MTSGKPIQNWHLSWRGMMMTTLLLFLLDVERVSAQFLAIENFSNAISLSSTAVNGAWYPDRYAPALFETTTFNAGSVLHHQISSAQAAANRTTGRQTSFYNTQGRTYNLGTGITVLTADLYIPAAWETLHRRADVWAKAYSPASATTPAVYPIIGFANTQGNNPVLRYFLPDGNWANIPMTITYDSWYSFRMEIADTTVNYYVNNNFVGSHTTAGATYFGSAILQGYNFADATLPAAEQDFTNTTYDIYWDNTGGITNIHNVTAATWHTTIQNAVDNASTGHVIEVGAGSYPGNVTVNKSVTINGPNAGIAGNGTRNTEAVIQNGTWTLGTANSTVSGFKFLNTVAADNQKAVAITSTGNVVFSDNIISREAPTSIGSWGSLRGIEMSAKTSGTTTISGNLFTGDGSNIYQNSSWRTAIWSNGGTGITYTNNIFENSRTAVNLDNFSAGQTIAGNTFAASNGTHLSFGGTVATTGQYTISGNEFSILDTTRATFNLSNVATTFTIDATGNTFNSVSPVAMNNQQKFATEATMYHRGRSGRNGVVNYIPGQQVVIALNPSIQKALDAAATGNNILVGTGTYNEDLLISKAGQSLTGTGAATTIIKGLYSGSAHTIQISANNVTLKHVTVTRDYGSTLSDWYASPKNQGITINQNVSGTTMDSIIVTGNRNGIYGQIIPNTTIKNSLVENNRTGIHFGRNVSGSIVENNIIRNNFTHGILYNADFGAAVNVADVKVRNNAIYGNWYAGINYQNNTNQTVNASDLQGYESACNWTGAAAQPTVSATGTSEPGYAAQAPSQFGGTNPGGAYDIAGLGANGITPVSYATSGTESAINYAVAGCTDIVFPAKNITRNKGYSLIQLAVDNATTMNGDTIVVAAGTYTENVTVNKSLTVLGPNAGIAGNGIRNAEAVILNSTWTLGNNDITVRGFKIQNTVTADGQKAITVAATGNVVIADNIISREAPGSTGSWTIIRGIDMAVKTAGTTSIANNLFTGDASAVYQNSSWRSAIWSNGGTGITYSNNVFEHNRSGINLNDFNAGQTLTGNTFSANTATHLSFGGTTPTNGQYTISGNEFGITDTARTTFNLSNVTTTFTIDASGNTFNGVSPAAMSNEQKFTVEATMYHRGRANRNGVVNYISGQQVVVPVNASIQKALDAAAANDNILVAPGTYNGDLLISKTGQSITGTDAATTIIKGLYSGAAHTIHISADNVTLKHVTVTRDFGANISDWYASPKNQGITINQNVSGTTIDSIIATGNRNAIYGQNIPNTTITHSLIENNRTGVHFGRNAAGSVIANNIIRNNFTHGILFNADFGAEVVLTNVQISENAIYGNWYSGINYQNNTNQAINSSSFTGYSATCNHFGAATQPVISAVATSEPGYAAQVPSQYGGTAPGSAIDVAGLGATLVAPASFAAAGTESGTAFTVSGCSDLVAFTRLQECGNYSLLVTDSLTADTVAGATDYSFAVSDRAGNAITTLIRTTNKLALAAIPGIAPGDTIKVKVRARVNGSWGDYGFECAVGLSSLTTQLQAGDCGRLDFLRTDSITAVPVPGATTYEFNIATLSNVLIKAITSTNNSIALDDSVFTPGAAFHVIVRSMAGGVYGDYGTSCTIAMANLKTQLQAADCGRTDFLRSESITANPVSGATQYEFKIATAANLLIKTIVSATNTIALSDTVFKPGVTLRVSVRSMAGGMYGVYDTVCTIAMADPHTEIEAAYCGETNIFGVDSVAVAPVANATSYEFDISTLAGVPVTTVTTTNNYLPLSAPAFVPGEARRVRVRVATNGVYGSFGGTCIVGLAQVATNLSAASCGKQNYVITDNIEVEPLVIADDYQLNFYNAATNAFVATVASAPSGSIAVSSVPGLVKGSSYKVIVRASVNGSWLPDYGDTCLIRIGDPKTKPLTCGGSINSMGFLTADSARDIAGAYTATRYKFSFRMYNAPYTMYESAAYESTTPSLAGTSFASLFTGGNYYIKVRALVAGEWTPVRDSCLMTLARGSRNKGFVPASDEWAGSTADNENNGLDKFTEASFTIAPNPVADVLTVTGKFEGKTTIVVQSLDGRILYRNETGAAQTEKQTINVAALPAGYYLLGIYHSNGQVVYKRFARN